MSPSKIVKSELSDIFDILPIDIRYNICLFAASGREENDSVERCGV